MGLYRRANDAINVNGNYKNGALADIAITTSGSDWYWVSVQRENMELQATGS